MPIEQAAAELLRAKVAFENAECELNRKRDNMYNELTRTQQNQYSYDGYIFSKTEELQYASTNKQLLINAVMAADIPEGVKNSIISAALQDRIRQSGLRITAIQRS